MQRGNLIPCATDPATQFIGALVQGASATLDLHMDEGIAAGRHCRSILRHLTIVSAQQLAWEIVLFTSRNFNVSSVAQTHYLSGWRFSASNGQQYGSSPYYYQASNIDLPYWDADFTDRSLPKELQGGFLHLMLVNRSPTTKLAGSAGAILITGYFEPTYG